MFPNIKRQRPGKKGKENKTLMYKHKDLVKVPISITGKNDHLIFLNVYPFTEKKRHNVLTGMNSH